MMMMICTMYNVQCSLFTLFAHQTENFFLLFFFSMAKSFYIWFFFQVLEVAKPTSVLSIEKNVNKFIVQMCDEL